MQDLVGQYFSLADEQYRIVDVRSVGSDAVIFAEKTDDTRSAGLPGHRRPRRAAFHLGDIAPYLSA